MVRITSIVLKLLLQKKKTTLLIRKSSFQRLIRELSTESEMPGLRMQPADFAPLQEAAEHFLQMRFMH